MSDTTLPPRAAPLVQPDDDSGRPASDEAAWCGRIGSVVADMAAATDLDAFVEVVVAELAAALDAARVLLWVVPPGAARPAVAALVGTSAADPEAAAAALRERRNLVVHGPGAVEQRFPGSADGRSDATLVCLPLLAGPREIGALEVLIPEPRTFTAVQDAFLTVLASACAQSLERIEALHSADRTAATMSLLARTSAELAGSLDYRATLSRVAELVVPTLGDWCAVQIVEDGVLQTVAVTHRDPQKVELAEQLQARYPVAMDAPTGAPNVVRTGVSELYSRITDEMLVAGTVDAEHLRLARELALHSAVVVPLATRGRVLGALTLMSAESRRSYDAEDVGLAEDVARRAAVAIDNAQLYSETREVALRLQHAVLPGPLDDLDGWEVAACYRPAGRTEVGGDFYDALPLADGRIVVVVGDIMGRGVAAAAAMSQMRASIRAYVAVDPDPAHVVGRLHEMFQRYAISRLVTVVVALLDPGRAELSVANAGHPPPLRVSAAGGVARLAPTRMSPPLGTGVRPGPATTWPVAADDTLLLYTDGLVERRDEDIEQGLDRLAARAPLLAGEDLGRAMAALVDAVNDVRRDDDLTALALRRRPVSTGGGSVAPGG